MKKISINLYPHTDLNTFEAEIIAKTGVQGNETLFFEMMKSLRDSHAKCVEMKSMNIDMNIHREFNVEGVIVNIAISTAKPSLIKRIFSR